MSEQTGLTIFKPQEKNLGVFGSEQSFVAGQRMANLLASSDMVPTAYKGKIQNCLVAIEIAQRVEMSPLMVMQNLNMIHGRPSWSSTFIIASINACGRFDGLKFKVELSPTLEEVEYVWYEWNEKDRKKDKRIGRIKIKNSSCYAWAKEKASGEIVKGPTITIKMAVQEGWYTKDGSKWPNMEELMLQYRAAAFFGRLHAPELMMGMRSSEEEREIIEVESTVVETKPADPTASAAAAAGVINDKIKSGKNSKKTAAAKPSDPESPTDQGHTEPSAPPEAVDKQPNVEAPTSGTEGGVSHI